MGSFDNIPVFVLIESFPYQMNMFPLKKKILVIIIFLIFFSLDSFAVCLAVWKKLLNKFNDIHLGPIWMAKYMP